jgi:hypothetical protein
MRATRSIKGTVRLPRVVYKGDITEWNVNSFTLKRCGTVKVYHSMSLPGCHTHNVGVTTGVKTWMDLVTRVEETFKVKVTKVCPNLEIQDGSSTYVVQADLMYKLLEACGGNKLRRYRASKYDSVQDGFPLMNASEVNPVDETDLCIPVLNKGTKKVSSGLYVKEWNRIIHGVEKLVNVKVVAYSPNLVIRDGYRLHFLHSQLALKLLEINNV